MEYCSCKEPVACLERDGTCELCGRTVDLADHTPPADPIVWFDGTAGGNTLALVSVYNIDAFLSMENARTPEGQELEPHGQDMHLAIIEGPRGVLVYGIEGVGWTFSSLNAEFPISAHVKRKIEIWSALDMLATHEVRTTLREIVAKTPYREYPFAQTVRVSGGHRLERNFGIMWDCLRKIGLDPTLYHPTGHRLAGEGLDSYDEQGKESAQEVMGRFLARSVQP